MGNISLFASGLNIALCLILAVVWNIALIAIGSSLLLSARKLKNEYNTAARHEYETTKREITDPAIIKSNEDIRKIENDMVSFWNLYKPLIEFLPEKYQTIDAIGFMLESVKNLRANTLTDVINLYEEELRWRKTQAAIAEQSMLQQLQNQRFNDTLYEIEQNQQKLHSDLQNIQAMQFFDMMRG